MNICLIADLHLFSSEIGGNWAEDSFEIFKSKILPAIEKEKPVATIFLGDILDPHSGRTDPRWPRGDAASRKFVGVLKESKIKKFYALKGNHDYTEPLKVMSEMGGPEFIDDGWLGIGNAAFYFFSSRYPNLQKAIDDLRSIPNPNIKAENKILLMHENVSVGGVENIPKDVMKEISKKFDLILNGHEHVYRNPYKRVYCLSSALPWRPGYDNCDIEITWKFENDKPEIKEKGNSFGFWILNTEQMDPKFIPVNLGIKIAMARLCFSNAPSEVVRQRLREFPNILSAELKPEKTILRVYLEGTLKEGDERIDVGFSNIEERCYSNFYEGRSRDILRVEKLKGGGPYLSKESLRYLSVEEALKQLEREIPKIREFYEEIRDLIEKKSLDKDTLIERIKNSKVVGE